MTDKTIGQCRCPVCSSKKASLRLSAKQLSYIVCNACNMQAFARSDASDAAMRALRTTDAAPDPTPAPAPAPAASVPATRSAQGQDQQTEADRQPWGVLSWIK